MSKLGLAALRVGWLEADEAIAKAIDKARQPFNVSATSQAAATAVLREAWAPVKEHVATIVAERERVVSAMREMNGVDPQPTEANFVWVRTDKDAREVHEALAARGVLVRSFHSSLVAGGGRMGKHVRITIGTREENDALLAALAEASA